MRSAIACFLTISDEIAATSVLLGRQVDQRTNLNVIIAVIMVRDFITIVIIAIKANSYCSWIELLSS